MNKTRNGTTTERRDGTRNGTTSNEQAETAHGGKTATKRSNDDEDMNEDDGTGLSSPLFHLSPDPLSPALLGLLA